MAGWPKLGALKKPTLFIWGKQDISFAFSNSKMLSELIPHAEVFGINNTAHWVNIEQAELVNSKLVEFLSENGNVAKR